jgi:hypothetical protein
MGAVEAYETTAKGTTPPAPGIELVNGEFRGVEDQVARSPSSA